MSDFFRDVSRVVNTGTIPVRVTASKASSEQSDDGVIIAKVAVAGNFDREKERILESALKAATWELVQNIGKGAVAVDLNHEADPIDCQIVGAYYDYDSSATIVHLKPADRAHVDAAKAGEIVGMSWSGPYTLREAV